MSKRSNNFFVFSIMRNKYHSLNESLGVIMQQIENNCNISPFLSHIFINKKTQYTLDEYSAVEN